ncbi:hypothetical protein [Nocardia sp. NPDC020380]|uniref:hypothetical protein n=1 Tax=Nocardia sp. NPDC020380 TaxID=3364309 RepID=UPI0037980A45
MQRITGTLGIAVLAAVTAFGIAGCNDKSTTGATGGTSTSSQPSSAAAGAFPASGHELVQCGTGPWGLAVVASTVKGNDYCPTAMAVVNAYAEQRAKQPDGDVAVVVADIRWVCGERQGDPNPVQQCASQNESAEKVRLVS